MSDKHRQFQDERRQRRWDEFNRRTYARADRRREKNAESAQLGVLSAQQLAAEQEAEAASMRNRYARPVMEAEAALGAERLDNELVGEQRRRSVGDRVFEAMEPKTTAPTPSDILGGFISGLTGIRSPNRPALGDPAFLGQMAEQYAPEVVSGAMRPMTDGGLGESPGVEMARINAQSREEGDMRRLERETQMAEMKHAQLIERDVIGAQLAMGQITAEAANRAQLEFYKRQGATDIEAFQIQSRTLQQRQAQLAEHLMAYEGLKAEAMASSRTRDLVPGYEKNIIQTRKLLDAQNAMIDDLVGAPPVVNAPTMPGGGWALGAPTMPGMTTGAERFDGGLGAPAQQQATPTGGMPQIPASFVRSVLAVDPKATPEEIQAAYELAISEGMDVNALQ